MAVYVDNMRAPFSSMIMCHMVADTDEELHCMAGLIGVARRWFQHADTPKRHYDICLSKRKLAVRFGAVEVTWRQLACMTLHRQVVGTLGDPATILEWALDRRKGG